MTINNVNDVWINAARKIAEEIGISQYEFRMLLDNSGTAGLLAECMKGGALHSYKPMIAEMPFEAMIDRDYLMPNSLFYTFAHGRAPVVDINTWKLSIEGDGVEEPVQLSYEDLLRLPSRTVTRSLDCAGNGRAFYDLFLHQPAMGSQWHLGGYGIAEWTGVPFSELLIRARLKKTAVDLMPVGIDSKAARRPMPVAKAMKEDTLLVYLMNGEILPADHGFPARAFLPGWIGSASIKWVNQIIVSTEPIHVTMNTTSYVFIGPDYQPKPPAKGPVLTTQVLKSACCLPWPASLPAGKQKVTGYAWSPFGKITRVDVSLDDSKSFQVATLIEPNIECAGVRWEFSFNAKPGNMTITPRATDEKGNTQHDISQQKWNQLGYLFGAMVPHPVKIS